MLGLLATIFAMLAVAMWRATLRPGVRVTASAFSWILPLGGLRAMLVDVAGADASTAHDTVSFVVALAASIACALLWSGASRRWVRS